MNIRELILNSEYPDYIKTFVTDIYDNDPELFAKELRKAENNSKRFGERKYDLWMQRIMLT